MIAQWVFRGVATGCLAAHAGIACASGLQVAPIGLTFTPNGPAQALWISNSSDQPLQAQVRLFRWTQSASKDALTPTGDMAVSPPMLVLQPGTRQLVRVIRLPSKAPSVGEEAYRVLVDELPQPETEKSRTTVHYLVRYSLPVFVGPSNPPDGSEVATMLRWSVVRDGGQVRLEVHNDGPWHAQVGALRLVPVSGPPIEVSDGLLGYVLPGMTMDWPLKPMTPSLGAGTQLRVSINGKPINGTLSIDHLPH